MPSTSTGGSPGRRGRIDTGSGLPVAYLSDGQRVPEDLHRAAPKRFWLLHNALKLSANAAVAPDENELAARFGHMELAANA